LEREEAGQTLRLSYERGQVLPINAGAAALALLAWAPDDEVDGPLAAPLTRFTEATYTDSGKLRAHLAEIREQGYAIGRGELDPDVLGIAAPVRSESGRVVAAISIAALSHRVPDSKIDQYVTPVIEAAGQLSAQVRLFGVS
jgi:DNA-binding IclR family transcriptional regulator